MTTTAAPEVTHRICNHCNRRRSIEHFRRYRRGSEQRRRECNDCRRVRDRKPDKRALASMSAEVRRRKDASAIMGVVLHTAEQLGGLEAMTRRWAELIQDPQASASWKLKSMQTLHHMLVIAEQARAAESIPDMTIADFLRELHREGQLAPVIHRCRSSPELTLDDLDPPPDALDI